MINPIKLNKSDINKEVSRVTRAGNLLSKDSVLYHQWRIFWVTEDVVHRIKVIRIIESGHPESLYTKGSLHPINSVVIPSSELEKTLRDIDPHLFDYAVVIRDGTLINHFMDFWIYVNYQIYLLENAHAHKASNQFVSIFNLKEKSSKEIELFNEFQGILIAGENTNAIHTFIKRYYDYSLQRVYLLNNDSLEIAPYNFSPEEIFCVSSGIKPVHYFDQMKQSLKKIHFCDYSPLALQFWKDVIQCKNMNALLSVFEKYSPYFLGPSANAMEAVKLTLNHQIENFFQDNAHFFTLLDQMKERSHFLQVDIIGNLDFLTQASGPYYFWFSNSYERNLTLLQDTKAQHREAHLMRLQRLKSFHQETIYYNTANYDFKIGSLTSPHSLGTQDIPDSTPMEWLSL